MPMIKETGPVQRALGRCDGRDGGDGGDGGALPVIDVDPPTGGGVAWCRGSMWVGWPAGGAVCWR
jgi:hypothetical protein